MREARSTRPFAAILVFFASVPAFPSATANAISLAPMQVVFNSYGAGSLNISTFNSSGVAADAPYVTFIVVGPS